MNSEDADELLLALGQRLSDEIEAALPSWVQLSVVRIHEAWSGSASNEVRAAALTASDAAVEEVVPKIRSLLALDVDAQWTNPLQLVRSAAAFPTAVLRELGVPEVVRDEFAERAAPADVYALEPAGFGELGDGLQEVGLAWGAAKARAHLARR